MVNEEKICPHVGEPCIGKGCSEFVPRHTRIVYYNWGIQDEFIKLWCLIKGKEYIEPTGVGTVASHCNIGVRSAKRWDKDEYKENWTVSK